MSDQPNIFEIISGLRDAVTRLETKLETIPSDVEFVEFKAELEKKLFEMTTMLNSLSQSQKLNKNQIQLVKLYLSNERKKEAAAAKLAAKEQRKALKEKKSEEKAEKKDRKKFWFEILKGVGIAGATAAFTYWAGK
jgi:Fe-S oxidoreductase